MTTSLLHQNDVATSFYIIMTLSLLHLSARVWYPTRNDSTYNRLRPNPLKPAVKAGMKILLEQHQLGMLQLRPSDHQFYRLLRCGLHWRFGDILYDISFQTSMNVTRYLARMELLATTLNHPGLTAVTVCLVITAPTVKLVSRRQVL